MSAAIAAVWSVWGAFWLGVGLGGACIVWGLTDWWLHRASKTIDAGGSVLFWRVYIGALLIAAGVYRLLGG